MIYGVGQLNNHRGAVCSKSTLSTVDWYYSLVDIVGALTDNSNPTDYLKKMHKRNAELGNYIGTNCPHVEILTHTKTSLIPLPQP